MLIGLCGAQYSGKTTIADYLVQHQQFTRLFIWSKPMPLKTNVLTRDSDCELPSEYYFQSAVELRDYVTKRWRERWLVECINDFEVIDILRQRPFFLLIFIESPLIMRWRRYQNTRKSTNVPLTIEEFICREDVASSDEQISGYQMRKHACFNIVNDFASLDMLFCHLQQLDLTDDCHLRPDWDTYFMSLAILAAQRSNCMKRRVGCVLVRDKRVISTGYNGTPRKFVNCNAGGCPRCNSADQSGSSLSTCLCLHAEENALIEAGIERIQKGAVLYSDTCPCLTCSIKISQVGISEIVYLKDYAIDEQALKVLHSAGVRSRRLIPRHPFAIKFA